jgi:hypothetical protein
LHLLDEKVGQVRLPFENADQLLESRKHYQLVRKKFPRGKNGGVREIARRNEDAPRFRPANQPDQVLRYLWPADRLRVPLHFDEVEVALDFDDAIDLLDYALARRPHQMEGLPDQDAVCAKDIVQRGLELFAP